MWITLKCFLKEHGVLSVLSFILDFTGKYFLYSSGLAEITPPRNIFPLLLMVGEYSSSSGHRCKLHRPCPTPGGVSSSPSAHTAVSGLVCFWGLGLAVSMNCREEGENTMTSLLSPVGMSHCLWGWRLHHDACGHLWAGCGEGVFCEMQESQLRTLGNCSGNPARRCVFACFPLLIGRHQSGKKQNKTETANQTTKQK